MKEHIKTAIQVVTILLALWLAQGCGWPPMPPEAWTAIANREVSIRAVGMMGVEPQSGTVFCILCYFTYSRNMPNPDPVRSGGIIMSPSGN